MKKKREKMTDPGQKNKADYVCGFPRLTEMQSRKIHEASLEILERVGVRLYLDEAVQLIQKAGASVADGNLVRVPSKIVERALKSVPKQVTLYNRNGEPAMLAAGHRCFYGPGSDCLNIIDHRTGQHRRAVVQDIVDGTILCDFLPQIDFVMSMVVPSDVDEFRADRYQMEAMLGHTTKPIIFVTYGIEGCRAAVEMAEMVMGGAEALKSTPFIAGYHCTISGLRHNKEALEKLLFLASKNLPSIYFPASTAAITSPVTPAGSLALDYAGVLVGLTLAQLKKEGTPVIFPGMPPGATFDMKTFVASYAEPERTIAQALGQFYGLPMFAIAGTSESKCVDSQAAAEAALSLVAETLAGGNIIHNLGYLESGLGFSLVQLVLCHEIVSWIKAFTTEFEVSDETLALDVIAAVGVDGDFLNTDHTLKHYRERWYPTYFERENYDSWLKKGGKDFVKRAKEAVDHILAEHRPEPLPNDIKAKLHELIQR
jgi:trimethylamine--corrinoid protein Co-methyltransferase